MDKSFEAFYSLLHELGLDISAKKLIHPTTRASCLGVIIYNKDFTTSVPDKKLGEIQEECCKWVHRAVCTKWDLQCLLGCLLYITSCVRSSRPFLSCMLNTLRLGDRQSKITLDTNFKRDLAWFLGLFLPQAGFHTHTARCLLARSCGYV